MNWTNDFCVNLLPYILSSDNILDVPVREATSEEQSVSDAPVSERIDAPPLKFIAELQKIIENTANAVSTLFGTSTKLPYPATDALFLRDFAVQDDDSHWNLQELTCIDDCGPFSLQSIQHCAGHTVWQSGHTFVLYKRWLSTR